MLASDASRIVPTPRLGLSPFRPGSVLALLVIPLVLMLVFSALPQLDVQLPAPWFHFQVVSFTSLIALVAAILIGNLTGPRSDVRALFVTFGLIAIAAVFLIHGVATPGVLFDTSVPVDHSAHAAILTQPPLDEYGSPVASSPTASSDISAAALAVTWSAPISLFVGALLFGLAVLPWSSRRQQWIGANRRYLWWVAVVLYAAYVAIALVFPAPLAELSRLSPTSLYALASLAMLAYAGAALYFWNQFRRRRQLAEGGMAVAAGLLAEAVVSMTLMPLWHLSWWLYHVLMAVAFICALCAVVIEYEHVRHFDLKHYFAAMSV